ncbi:DapH/DapD/GlmU-related protein [Methyloradius palustris]|uniref:Lipopolysaccharide biosynthesis O-acetyl transferase WbbJ n=1 Tax=Methyloradius palustris TaxID=2778876 RepID=A0A8D5G8X5_9PROT|nr:DapH/DapD/GlmU-related protein [Methyloradius palustris]BCM25281.1 putative lipopolysaccharide biosynthesis O-acetyl transferase WbbJ [Methyloradius palustris]
MSFLRFVFGNVRYVLKSSSNERSLAAIIKVIKELVNIAFSILSAKVVGWPNSCLGSGSRVSGSNGIVVKGLASIKKQAWIEAVFKYNAQLFSPSIIIGYRFYAADRLHISAINKIEIGDDCLFGSSVYISDHNHGSYKGIEQSNPQESPIARKLVSLGPVIIGNNVWLGDNVVIVGPVKIGSGSVIGANSVITKDIPEMAIAAGVPAQILKKFNVETNVWEKVIN